MLERLSNWSTKLLGTTAGAESPETAQVALEALNKGFAQGFVVAAALGALCVLTAVLVWALCRSGQRRGRVTIQTVDSELGSLYITVNAIREFVTRILCEFQEASLRNVSLRPGARGFWARFFSLLTFRKPDSRWVLTIEADALPTTDLVALQAKVSQRVLEEAGTKMGTNFGRVDIVIHSYSAKQAKIDKQTRRAGAQPIPQQALPPDEPPEQLPEDATTLADDVPREVELLPFDGDDAALAVAEDVTDSGDADR